MTDTTAMAPPGVSGPLWIQLHLSAAGVSQAEIGRRTRSSESSVSRCLHGTYLGPYPTERGIARQHSIRTEIAKVLGSTQEALWPEPPENEKPHSAEAKRGVSS